MKLIFSDFFDYLCIFSRKSIWWDDVQLFSFHFDLIFLILIFENPGFWLTFSERIILLKGKFESFSSKVPISIQPSNTSWVEFSSELRRKLFPYKKYTFLFDRKFQQKLKTLSFQSVIKVSSEIDIPASFKKAPSKFNLVALTIPFKDRN